MNKSFVRVARTNTRIEKPIHGWGINDSIYQVKPRLEDGTKDICPYYRVWSNMVHRCKGDSYLKRNPTYIGVEICEEWRLFSGFLKWAEVNMPLVGGRSIYQLDKDLTIKGSKIYSPDTAAFVPHEINLLLGDCAASRGIYKLGVSLHSRDNTYRARCHFNGKEKIKYSKDEFKAHRYWQEFKLSEIERIIQLCLAGYYDITGWTISPKVVEGLKSRAKQLSFEILNGIETVKL